MSSLALSTGRKNKKTKDRFIELRAQGLPLAKIATDITVSKTTLISWERDLKDQIDNLRAVELEAVNDKYCVSTQMKVEFFGDVFSRIPREPETRDLSEILTEKLFAKYAHVYRDSRPVEDLRNHAIEFYLSN